MPAEGPGLFGLLLAGRLLVPGAGVLGLRPASGVDGLVFVFGLVVLAGGVLGDDGFDGALGEVEGFEGREGVLGEADGDEGREGVLGEAEGADGFEGVDGFDGVAGFAVELPDGRTGGVAAGFAGTEVDGRAGVAAGRV